MIPDPPGSRWTPPFGSSTQAVAIFLISILALYLEMLLIRWLGTEIRIFAYLQNTILVVSFLGLGLGCFTCRQPIALRQGLVPMAFLLLLIAVPITNQALGQISKALSLIGDLVIWGGGTSSNPGVVAIAVAVGLAMVYLLLILVVDIFVPIGRILGRLMDAHPDPITAYSLNIAGSLIGTWLFVLLSAFYQPPVVWYSVAAVLLLPFAIRQRRDRKVVLALLLLVVGLSWPAGRGLNAIRTVWSPYQKLTLRPPDHQTGEIGDYIVTVNNTGYQMMADLSPAHTRAAPDRFDPGWNGLSQYDLPLLIHPNTGRYLVVGAGSGNDVAAGVRHGVPEIVAVEIDPAIIALGRAYHPEQPYASPAVRVVNADARSFFATTHETFDLITFGLLDSHTTTAMTNARLDSYVYTRESLTQAKSLLAPGGTIVLSFEAQKSFIADRMARVLRDVFGEAPLAFTVPPSAYGWGGVIFVTGDLAAVTRALDGNPRLKALISGLEQSHPLALSYTTRITTDDWPYTYLEFARIPTLYFLLAGVMLAIWIRSSRRYHATVALHHWSRTHWHFFFLGAGFLLLEVQNVSKASVVLGNTWEVNAVIVSGALAMTLLANWMASRWPAAPLGAAYLVLLGLCLGLYFVDLARFAFLSYPAKALVVGGLTTCPVLFSGLVFVRSFAAVERRDEALGANLLGALVGAVLQSLTFVTGIKALLLVVAAFYLLSLISLPRKPIMGSLRPT